MSDSRKAVRTSGDVLAFVTPVASLATVLVLQDWQGLKQGALTGITTIGLTYALKYIIKKERPDHSNNHSFPSMLPYPLPVPLLFKGVMVGNGEYRPMLLPPM